MGVGNCLKRCWRAAAGCASSPQQIGAQTVIIAWIQRSFWKDRSSRGRFNKTPLPLALLWNCWSSLTWTYLWTNVDLRVLWTTHSRFRASDVGYVQCPTTCHANKYSKNVGHIWIWHGMPSTYAEIMKLNDASEVGEGIYGYVMGPISHTEVSSGFMHILHIVGKSLQHELCFWSSCIDNQNQRIRKTELLVVGPLQLWGFIRHRPPGPLPRIRLALPSSEVVLASK